MITRLQTLLSELELSELLPLFESQGIDDAVLGVLTDTDLKEIGIEKLGDRRKLLKAFGEGSTSPVEEKPVEITATEAPRSTPQDQFTYDAQNGEIIITGFTGKGHVVVPDKFDDLDLPVRVIGAKAFQDNGMLLSVVLPEGITRINGSYEDGAFRACSSLTSITIPEGVTHIGDGTFCDCGNLTSITIPEGVTHIGNRAFLNCSSLTSITIPESDTHIGDFAFGYCSSLTNITIPKGVTMIREYAFKNCSSELEIEIPPHLASRFEGSRFKISVRNGKKTVPISKASKDEKIPARIDPTKKLFDVENYLIFVGAALMLIAIVVIFVVYARTT